VRQNCTALQESLTIPRACARETAQLFTVFSRSENFWLQDRILMAETRPAPVGALKVKKRRNVSASPSIGLPPNPPRAYQAEPCTATRKQIFSGCYGSATTGRRLSWSTCNRNRQMFLTFRWLICDLVKPVSASSRNSTSPSLKTSMFHWSNGNCSARFCSK
jgi:hypothetical protein